MHPIKQFEIHTLLPLHLFGIDVSITNFTIATFVVCALCLALPYLAIKRQGRLLALLELSFDLVSGTMEQYAHELRYFPFIFTVFIFVLTANMLGILPYVPTVTSQIVVTLTLACVIYCALLILGVIQKGWRFFRIFLPASVPLYLAPFFIPIEVISFLSKPFSMAIRLFANMVAGHVVLKIFAGFVVSLIGIGWLWKPLSLLPIIVNTGMICFEIAVAFIQAYVFTILSCIYISEMLGDSH